VDCSAALLASQLVSAVSRGDVYQQVEWILLDAHSLLVQHQLNLHAESQQVVGTACERLSALIRRVTLPVNDDLLQLQLKVRCTSKISTVLLTFDLICRLEKGVAYYPHEHNFLDYRLLWSVKSHLSNIHLSCI